VRAMVVGPGGGASVAGLRGSSSDDNNGASSGAQFTRGVRFTVGLNEPGEQTWPAADDYVWLVAISGGCAGEHGHPAGERRDDDLGALPVESAGSWCATILGALGGLARITGCATRAAQTAVPPLGSTRTFNRGSRLGVDGHRDAATDRRRPSLIYSGQPDAHGRLRVGRSDDLQTEWESQIYPTTTTDFARRATRMAMAISSSCSRSPLPPASTAIFYPGDLKANLGLT